MPKEVPRLQIAAHRLRGSISLLGARLDDLVLTDYRETLAPNSPNVRLLEPRSEAHPYYVQYGWSAAPGEQVKLPDNDTVWTGSGGTLSAGHPVTLSWDNGAGLTFQITLSVDDDYMFDVQQSVKNATGTPVKLFPWSRIRRDYTPEVAGYYILFEGLLGVVDGTLQETTYAKAKSEGEKKNGIAYDATATGGWAGITDKYWLTALVPDQAVASTVNFHPSIGERRPLPGGLHHQGAADGRRERRCVAVLAVFAGAKIVRLLDRYQAEDHIPNFDKAVDFGWFYFLTKPIFYCLDWLNGLLGEFRPGDHGVHRVRQGAVLPAGELLVPIDEQDEAAGAEDAGAARAVQGRAAAHAAGDDGDVPDREGEPGVGLPADGGADSGVLLALQGDLRHHRDAPGAVLRLDPRPVAGGSDQHLQPVRADPVRSDDDFAVAASRRLAADHGRTMFLQQKLNPPPPDPVQARMFQFMPIIFTFMLASFPAGLVIYWSWNNLLSIAQQWLIMRRTHLARPGLART